MDDELRREMLAINDNIYVVDAFISIVREAGYVKLAEDQVFPKCPYKEISMDKNYDRGQIRAWINATMMLLEDGWRKVVL